MPALCHPEGGMPNLVGIEHIYTKIGYIGGTQGTNSPSN